MIVYENKSQTSVRACKRCKAPIHENSLREYCPKCYDLVEDKFKRIREYLEKYPGSTAFEIEQRLGIPLHVINNFIREGRLVETPNQYLNVECLRCGTLLLSAVHKYCPKCQQEIQNDLEKAKQGLAAPQNLGTDKGKMRFKSYTRK